MQQVSIASGFWFNLFASCVHVAIDVRSIII